MPKCNLKVDELNTNLRLDLYISLNSELSRSNIQKLIKDNKVPYKI